MKFTIKALTAVLTISFGAVQAAPIARVILNSDPGEFVGNGGFYDMTLDPVRDTLNLSVYPNTYAPPMVGFAFSFGHAATNRWGSVGLYGMTAGSTSRSGSVSFWGSGCNHTDISSQTHESVVSGFTISRFVASFTQSCGDTPYDSDTKVRGIFIYDTSGEVAVPAYLANSPILTSSVPESSSVALVFLGLATLGFIESRRRRK